MINLQSFREIALKKLSAVSGPELEMSCNLTSPSQFALIEESYAHSVLGDEYTGGEKDLYLRVTNGYNARFRQDIVEIGHTPEWINKGGGSVDD